MKRCLSLVLLITLIFALGGCGSDIGTESNVSQSAHEDEQISSGQENDEGTVSEQDDTEAASTDEKSSETGSGSDILVVYFSRTGEQYNVGVIDKGNTAIVAEMIADETGADTFELLPENDTYPRTYDELTDVAKREQNDNARPAIKGDLPDLSKYSCIFIGAPVWWGDWPMICYTYFEANDFSGKKLIPFSTHEGSGLAGFDTKLGKAADGADVLTGLAIQGEDAQNDQSDVREDVKDWISGLGL